MKKMLGVLLLATLVLAGCSSTKSAVVNLSAKEFSEKIQESGVVLLDVRTAGEFAQGHISGAENVDVEASTFNSQIAKLDKKKTYAVYCHSGRRSGIATAAMARAGFGHIYNLQNGLLDWMSQGLATVNS